MTALVVAVCVLALALMAVCLLTVGGGLLRPRHAPGPPLAGRTVVVHTRRPDDQTLRGVLVAQHADRLTLREAVYVHASGEQPAGGLVHVPTEAVAWIQELER